MGREPGWLQGLLQHAGELALVCDPQLVVRYASPALHGTFGYDQQDVIGVSGWNFIHPEDVDEFRGALTRVMSTPRNHARVEIRVRRADGEWALVEERVTNLLDDAAVGGLILNVRELTDRRLAEAGPRPDDGALQLGADLPDAIAEDQIRLHYQPIVDLATNTVSGAEALARWQHPQLGLLSPDRFVPLAENIGLIEHLGSWALHRACRDAADWDGQLRSASIAVNLSVRQLGAAVVHTVGGALRATALDPARLVLEVTESAALDDLDAASATLRRLSEMGIRIALDDFGTGYSSLTHLRRFPVGLIKIDRSFVSGLGTSAADTAIVATLLDLAASLDVTVVAEGVETRRQSLVLLELGCRLGQGHLWSPAVPAEELSTVVDLLASARGRTRTAPPPVARRRPPLGSRHKKPTFSSPISVQDSSRAARGGAGASADEGG
jgi:PAS domain S-box-containing protein